MLNLIRFKQKGNCPQYIVYLERVNNRDGKKQQQIASLYTTCKYYCTQLPSSFVIDIKARERKAFFVASKRFFIPFQMGFHTQKRKDRVAPSWFAFSRKGCERFVDGE